MGEGGLVRSKVEFGVWSRTVPHEGFAVVWVEGSGGRADGCGWIPVLDSWRGLREVPGFGYLCLAHEVFHITLFW
jgi:hypothetical protein